MADERRGEPARPARPPPGSGSDEPSPTPARREPRPTVADAYWVTAPGRGEIRRAGLPRPGPGEVLVRALHSAVSRGTEALVALGRVPPSQHAAMRAPFQEGGFPFPVKYGYSSVGVVEEGPAGLARPRGVLPPPAPDRLRGPGRGGAAAARGRPARARRARRQRRDRAQRRLGRGRPAGRADPRHRRRRRRLPGRLAARPAAGGRGDAGRHRPGAGRRRRGARRRLRPARGARPRRRPRRPRQRQPGRACAARWRSPASRPASWS